MGLFRWIGTGPSLASHAMGDAMTTRIAAVLALKALLLVGCGQGGDAEAPDQPAPSTPAVTTPPPAPALTDAEKTARLASLPAPYNAGDLENGRRAFARCRSCHTLVEGGANMTGPNLWNLFGRRAGTHPDFRYSEALAQAGFDWDAERLDQWLANPREFLPGNRMAFAGLRDETDRRDLIAYLKVETGYTPE